MKYGIISLFVFSFLLASCADDKESTEDTASEETQEMSQESFPTEVEKDEEGVPLPCSVIADEMLASELAEFSHSDRVPEKMEQATSQSCSMALFDEDGRQIGEIRLIVKAMEAEPDREQVARRTRNTNYVDDLPVPAMWRQVSSLTTLIFDHNLHVYSLNVNLRNQNNEAQYQLARSIAIHIVDNVKE